MKIKIKKKTLKILLTKTKLLENKYCLMSNSNQTNKDTDSEASLSKDDWISLYASTLTLDVLYVYVLTPIAIIAFILNVLAYLIFKKGPFQKGTIFRYLRIYVVNSSIICFFLLTVFIFSAYRIIDITNTYEAVFYGIYIISPLLSIFYLSGSLLEVCILIERSSKITDHFEFFKKVKKFRPTCIILYTISTVINIPVIFQYYPAFIDVPLQNSKFRLYYWGITDFSVSTWGKILTFAMYALRDIVVLIIKVILNIISVYLVRDYLKKIKNDSIFTIDNRQSKTIDTNLKATSKKSYISKTDRNLTYMAILMCILSACENILYATSYIYFTISPNTVSLFVAYFSYFSLALKNFFNFIVFFLFNESFNAELKKSICF